MQRPGATTVEFPVTWVDVPGSTFTPARHGVSSVRASSPTIAWRMRRLRADRAGRSPSDRRPAAGAAAPGRRAARASAGGGELTRRSADDGSPSSTGATPGTRWPVAPSATPGSSRVPCVDAGAHVDFCTARDQGQSAHEQVDGIRVRPTRRDSSPSTPGRLWLGCCCDRRRLDAVLDADCGIPVVLAAGALATAYGGPAAGPPRPPRPVRARTSRPALARVGRFLEGWLMPRVYRGRARRSRCRQSTVHEMRERLGLDRSRHAAPQREHPDRRQPVPTTGNPTGWSCSAGWPGTSASTSWSVPFPRLLPLRPDAQAGHHRQGARARTPSGPRWPNEGWSAPCGSMGSSTTRPSGTCCRRSRLHVSASDVEGWGQVVIEAAANGYADARA